MKYHNDIEEEVDEIRDKLYTNIKEMTNKERIVYINSRVRETLKKHGISNDVRPQVAPHSN